MTNPLAKFNKGKWPVFCPKDQKSVLNEAERTEVIERLGWLNIFNFERVEFDYELDLENKDHHALAEVLVELAVKEPGENWIDEQYKDVRIVATSARSGFAARCGLIPRTPRMLHERSPVGSYPCRGRRRFQ